MESKKKENHEETIYIEADAVRLRDMISELTDIAKVLEDLNDANVSG